MTRGHNIVADGWAGAEMRCFILFDLCTPRTDGQTDGWMDGRMDPPSYKNRITSLENDPTGSGGLASFANGLTIAELHPLQIRKLNYILRKGLAGGSRLASFAIGLTIAEFHPLQMA